MVRMGEIGRKIAGCTRKKVSSLKLQVVMLLILCVFVLVCYVTDFQVKVYSLRTVTLFQGKPV